MLEIMNASVPGQSPKAFLSQSMPKTHSPGTVITINIPKTYPGFRKKWVESHYEL